MTFNDITKGSRSTSSPLPPTSVLRTELADLEPQEEDAPKRVLWYTPMSWLGVIRPHRRDRDESWSASLYCCPFSLDRSGCPAAAPTSPPTSFFSRHLPESPLAPAPPTSKHTAPVASSSSSRVFAMRIPPCRTLLPPSSRETDAGKGASNPASVGQMHCIAEATPPEDTCSPLKNSRAPLHAAPRKTAAALCKRVVQGTTQKTRGNMSGSSDNSKPHPDLWCKRTRLHQVILDNLM